jgi:hypothetical protein
MLFTQYSKQHSSEYNRLGSTADTFTQSALIFLVGGNCGFMGYFLFHVLAWWAQQLRSAANAAIQLSRTSWLGTLKLLATVFFIEVSAKLL